MTVRQIDFAARAHSLRTNAGQGNLSPELTPKLPSGPKSLPTLFVFKPILGGIKRNFVQKC